LKPIVVLDFEYKHYGERLCGKCKKPVFSEDDKGYKNYYKYCPHCGTEVEEFEEGDKIIYAKLTIEGYEFFDKEEKTKREEDLKNKRRISKIDEVLFLLDSFYSKNDDLRLTILKRLQEAGKIITEVKKELGGQL